MKKNKKLANAILHISDCLMDYAETSINSDKLAQRALDKAWNVITEHLITENNRLSKLICNLHEMTLDWIDSDAIGMNDSDTVKVDALDADWQRILDKNNINLNFKEIWRDYVDTNQSLIWEEYGEIK